MTCKIIRGVLEENSAVHFSVWVRKNDVIFGCKGHFEDKTEISGFQGKCLPISRPRPHNFVLKVSSRMRTVLEDPILVT